MDSAFHLLNNQGLKAIIFIYLFIHLLHNGPYSLGSHTVLFYHPQPRSEKLGSETRQVKQSYFSLSRLNGHRVTKAHYYHVQLTSDDSNPH